MRICRQKQKNPPPFLKEVHKSVYIGSGARPTSYTLPSPLGVTYSILWILRDLEHMDEVTRDYAVGITDSLRRRLMLLPWRSSCDYPSEDSAISPQPKQVSENFFRAARQNETLPLETISPTLPTHRKIRVYAEYGELGGCRLRGDYVSYHR